jgi:periplasmic mercuric ion binding protein
MKKNIFLILFVFAGFAFTSNAQSCCSSKAKDKSSCTKKTASTTATSSINEGNAVLVSNVQSATEKTEKFTVYGNCGMCERTIENSLKEVKGVSLADWDKETDEMSVTFDPELISLDAIKQKIADVGYDSDTHRAKEEVYNSLPGCCQYDRPKN